MHLTREGRQKAEASLRERGVQPTSQRIEILQCLRENQAHLSADDLYLLLVRDGKKISRATVYNTLNLLKDHRLINEFVVEPGRVLFDPVIDPHYHFYDIDTHELTDVLTESVGITCLPLLPDGAEFRGIEIVVKISRKR